MNAKELGSMSAYPVSGDHEREFLTGQTSGYGSLGLTKREAFAMAAMQGLLAGQYRDGARWNLSAAPEEAFKIADAMLAESAKEQSA